MFCYQQNFFTPTKEVNREQFWALVGAPYTRECIDNYRATGDGAWKKRLPAFVFQATFDETLSKTGNRGRWRKQSAARLTGLVVMDVDHIDNPLGLVNEKLGMSREKWAALGVLLVYVTPSGHGLKIVFKARTEWGNLIDNQHKMAEVLGVEVDESCKDASRLSFICKQEDILYINEDELFSYENREYVGRFNGQYRDGNSRPTGASPESGEVRRGLNEAPQKDDKRDFRPPLAPPDSGGELSYHGIAYSKIVDAWLDGKQPQEGDRHSTSLKLACDLRYITDNDPQLIERILRSLPWVDAIVRERGEDVAATVRSALDYKMLMTMPRRMQEAIEKLKPSPAPSCEGGETELPLRDWGEQIEALKGVYPCLKEALVGLPTAGYPAAMFTAAAFFGTLMTRTWYYFYHHPEEERRLNYCVFVIGDPASGKSFANRLYKQIVAPIKTADKVGYDAINRYKEETRTKGSNKEKPKKPAVIIRDHPARTANGVFITDMNNAVETVEGKRMHLHMLTFDTELDNATSMGKGGQWIDKSAMELKAFHNEEDGQAYGNLDSVSGPFNVYWNFVYTGTPLSLQRKVTERNFGSGLATRLAVIPLPPSGFKMMELKRRSTVDYAADETLKTWAYRLDGVSGELPLWPLVEVAWKWTNERMEIAGFNQDKADEMLLKRVAYYGIGIAAPFIMMRHWDEWQQSKTLTIDDVDFQLSRLVMDIQYRCQHRFFGEYARNYFDNLDRDNSMIRSRHSKYDECFKRLPQTFGIADVEQAYDVNNGAAKKIAQRLASSGAVTRTKQGVYHKLKSSLI